MAKLTDIVIIVDDKDKVLQYLSFSQTSNDMRWRDTAIYLFNDNGQVLIAKRHAKKRVLPNCWGPTASGTVESHESYEQNAYKELSEEVGLAHIKLTHINNVCMNYDEHKRFTGLFKGVYNGKIDSLILEKDQVQEARWISIEELRQEIANDPSGFVPRLAELLLLAVKETK